MRRHIVNILLVLVFIAGFSLLLYPTVSDYWNSFHQSRAIRSYEQSLGQLDDNSNEEMLEAAREYNRSLASGAQSFELSEEEKAEYEKLLDVTGSGMMSYIRIPKIKCELPIYHGTDEAVLQVALGHLAGSSLPIGGESTHTVITGHRGLPSARLFTDIDELEAGDRFTIQTLKDILTYEVDQINIVLPDETDNLLIEEGQDYCTLITCTPYGVNSHRLLVRGHRVANDAATTKYVTTEAYRVDTIIVAPIFAIPIMIILLIIVLIKTRKRKK